MISLRSPIAVLLLVVVAASATLSAEPQSDAEPQPVGEFDAERIAYFESHIRPVLVRKCYQCHSAKAKTLQGGLRVDSRAGLLKGGESGPAVVAGKPEESLLLEALRHESFEMPPKGKLDDAVVARFENWIKTGAADPRAGDPAPVAQAEIDIEAGRQFWAFQAPVKHEPPSVNDAAWPRSDIDHFILGRLEDEGIKPAADADRATLLRRATFALTGLAPTTDELDAFLADDSPAAWRRAVDRLLASPAFGERWGRHWLDVARYADSNGGGPNFTFDNAWRYRDYVIAAFNDDKPYDRFIAEQLAGDLLPHDSPAQRREQLIATGFLLLGSKELAEYDKAKVKMDTIDEQIDTCGRALLGLTLGCARCHDHKFDPIPTRDYYALAGVFASTASLKTKRKTGIMTDWQRIPLPVSPEAKGRHQAARRELTQKANRWRQDAQRRLKELQDELAAAKQNNDLMRVPTGVVVDDKAAILTGAWSDSSRTLGHVGDGYRHDGNEKQGEKICRFIAKVPQAGRYEARLLFPATDNRATNVAVTVEHAGGETHVAIDQSAPEPTRRSALLGVFELHPDKPAVVAVSNAGADGFVIADAVQFVAEGQQPWREVSPSKRQAKLADIESEIKQQKMLLSGFGAMNNVLRYTDAEPVAMAVRDEPQPHDEQVRIRGGVHAKGEKVPRGFLQVAAFDGQPQISPGGSGRLEMARWMTDRRHPLTARVMVNRVWRHLFGVGLVRTTDNFGLRGERPSHPELLDYLAVDFMEHGWSVKRLIRQIMLSRVYQLSAADDPTAREIDGDNRLLWRAPVRRLEIEAIRDAVLQLSGQLDLTPGGRTLPHSGRLGFASNYFTRMDMPSPWRRRSVYLPMIRGETPDEMAAFTVFDFADPSIVVGDRATTTAPTQALFLMNSEFILDNARLIAAGWKTAESDRQRVRLAFRQLYSRAPSDDETAACLAHVEAVESICGSRDRAWTSLCQTLLASGEFLYLQ